MLTKFNMSNNVLLVSIDAQNTCPQLVFYRDLINDIIVFSFPQKPLSPSKNYGMIKLLVAILKNQRLQYPTFRVF